MPSRATQATWVIVESYDKMWSIRKGNDKPLQYSCLKNPMNIMKRQKDMILDYEPPRLVGVQYATGKSGETAPKRMKRLGQSRNDVQLCLAVKEKSDLML